MNKTDLIVIGAGPAGLIAAATAAEKGLKVVMLEAKNDISNITRTCAQIFYLTHIGSGQAYTKPVKVDIEAGNTSRFIFPDIGLSVDYKGILRACYEWTNLSPNGTCVLTSKNMLWGFVYDKGILLKGLLADVERFGVTVRTGTMALDAENTEGGVRVKIRDASGDTSFIDAKYAIVANGINSRIVENLGLNKERKTLSEPIKLYGQIMDGVECPYAPSTWIGITYPSITPYINVWMGPMADGRWQLGTTAKSPGSPVETMKTFLNSPYFGPWFKNAKIVKKSSCFITPRYPIAEPVVGNIIIAGDCASPAETWNQGAMACGHQAVHAILEEDTGKYISWWKESFHFNSPIYYEELAKYPALNMFFNDDEVNYLFGLMKGRLVNTLLDGIKENSDRISSEKPDIYEKLKKVPNYSI